MVNNLIEVVNSVTKSVLGNEKTVKLVLAAFLCKGHVLIEGVPGVGKTTMARAFAAVLGDDYKRIQCTSDMTPSDVIGCNIFDAKTGLFKLYTGPIFTSFLLIDEINRSAPKTQSAFLEAMEEKQVTIDGIKYDLPENFIVIATQNPFEELGTYRLPDSQMDRFLFKAKLEHPQKSEERILLERKGNAIMPKQLIIDKNINIENIFIEPKVMDYIHNLVIESRKHGAGISTRGAIALVNASKAWAAIHGRDYVVPEDVQNVMPNVFEHRLSHNNIDICQKILEAVIVP